MIKVKFIDDTPGSYSTDIVSEREYYLPDMLQPGDIIHIGHGIYVTKSRIFYVDCKDIYIVVEKKI